MSVVTFVFTGQIPGIMFDAEMATYASFTSHGHKTDGVTRLTVHSTYSSTFIVGTCKERNLGRIR